MVTVDLSMDRNEEDVMKKGSLFPNIWQMLWYGCGWDRIHFFYSLYQYHVDIYIYIVCDIYVYIYIQVVVIL